MIRVLIAALFFVIGLAGLAMFTWEGYAYFFRRTTISRWMANLLKGEPAAFAALEIAGAMAYVLLLAHFASLIPFWMP